MTPDELSMLLSRDEYHVITISPKNFSVLEPYIGKRAYTYRPEIAEPRIKMPTQMHGTVSMWAANLIAIGEVLGVWDPDALQFIPEGRLRGFTAEYQGITKVPDCAIVLRGRLWPTIVFEFGYQEPYADLKGDVKLLLEGSEGKISKAVIVKIKPLWEGEVEIQRGFIEVWHMSEGGAKK